MDSGIQDRPYQGYKAREIYHVLGLKSDEIHSFLKATFHKFIKIHLC